ncbi:tetratricopeptide repeat-containing sulfotransferase family protein [Pseudoxanthomonas sp. PXM02]|uniref:tetratricopeptide repeat-containing sulfotransferase family protein n=1 Tax=Pseudoxanthomonas sp. PXM02 TaxID=2769294 RepID=UPI00178580FC|nr:tetratricopeptide repeat-containing sulfotransferase family protein [Pseudoxanthomonas sp. PXM02]MBD9479484.1 sulfotransferase [Pseudoxanthomonas sp. PXM02]
MNHSPITRIVEAYESGHHDTALALCHAALEDRPDDPTLWTLIGMALQAKGRYADAIAAYERMTARYPESLAHWANLGAAARLGGDYRKADHAYRNALAIDPRHVSLIIDHGLLLLEMGLLGEARHRLLDAVDLAPGMAEARINAALVCFECGDAQRAATLIPPAAEWDALPSDLKRELATVLVQVGRTDDAERLLLSTESDSAGTMVRLAQLLERTNRVEQARELVSQLGERAESLGGHERVDLLQLQAAIAMRDKDYAQARLASEAILLRNPHVQAETTALFTLASIADRQKQPADAMIHLEKAHTIQFRLAADVVPEMTYAGAEPLKVSSKWLTAEEARFRHAPHAPFAGESPTFIVGFPRSGTTMLEQMLDAHPGYASMDERATLQRCIEHMEKRGFAYPHALDAMDASSADELRTVYWTEVAKVISLAPGQQLVDKNPLNMLRLPMIVRLFPNAKIILALRHPCDVLLSCYMQNFRSPAFMVLCSSLERLAKSYVNAMRFWIHHQALLSPDTLTLRYEDTVGDFPAQVERIGAFLGIEDRDFLAQFSQHAARKGYISTPSYSQVVEPVNARAVGRWQPYARWLAPALPILQPVADHWGYDLTIR